MAAQPVEFDMNGVSRMRVFQKPFIALPNASSKKPTTGSQNDR
jgi:hypothetical protein